jgi:signal peptide peptidase SppA
MRWKKGVAIVPVVRIGGAIGAVTPLRPGVTLSGLAKILEKAFGMRGVSAVALVVNSPGGSPVQSHLIHQRVRQLATEQDVPVIAFVEDVAASGGYMIACAADEIIVDPSSIVGSIGVVGGSFGFSELLRKVGIERRLYTSGEHKAMLDPFLPENPEDVERLKAIQRQIHEQFIALVKERRGTRLDEANDEIFSGAFWVGEKAIRLGLADALGDVRSTLRARFGEEVLMPVISPASGMFQALVGRRGAGMAMPAADDLISALETRAIWSRFGI